MVLSNDVVKPRVRAYSCWDDMTYYQHDKKVWRFPNDYPPVSFKLEDMDGDAERVPWVGY